MPEALVTFPWKLITFCIPFAAKIDRGMKSMTSKTSILQSTWRVLRSKIWYFISSHLLSSPSQQIMKKMFLMHRAYPMGVCLVFLEFSVGFFWTPCAGKNQEYPLRGSLRFVISPPVLLCISGLDLGVVDRYSAHRTVNFFISCPGPDAVAFGSPEFSEWAVMVDNQFLMLFALRQYYYDYL
jgi:hypothetical protein